MAIEAVIFDMDGLLIHSEPLWQQAANEALQRFNISLTDDQYNTTMGLRTEEFVAHWFSYFNLPAYLQPEIVNEILGLVTDKIKRQPVIMPGVSYIIEYFLRKQYKIGIATSSPGTLAAVVMDLLNIRKIVNAVSTAEHLPFGKPHPQVYIDCATALKVSPVHCICFEDSFNGMIAAKAAKMKCVVVPPGHQANELRWGAADLKISSLQNFNDLLMQHLL